MLMFAVQDQGIGIAPEKMSQLFNRYSRLHSQPNDLTNGLGVGLYITKRIITAHGGDITVDSEPGKGTCFTVTLPMHVPETSIAE